MLVNRVRVASDISQLNDLPSAMCKSSERGRRAMLVTQSSDVDLTFTDEPISGLLFATTAAAYDVIPSSRRCFS